MRRRRRTLPYHFGTGVTEVFQYPAYEGAPLPGNPYIRDEANLGTILGSQVTDSESHRWPPRGGVTGDVGGEFFTQRKYVIGSPMHIRAESKENNVSSTIKADVVYNGPLWPLPPSQMGFPPSGISPDTELTKLGTEAVANTKPTNAIVNLSTFLSELLREGMPRIPFLGWKERADSLRNAGDQYLNYQFGWAPLISEINDFREQIRNADKIISQYERDAGRLVRRRWDFPEKRSKTTIEYQDFTSGYYAPLNSWLSRAGRSFTIKIETETRQKSWFSGAFVYHLPSSYYAASARKGLIARFDALFDVTPTPETIWNLAPWSWAVDWFSSAGDAFSNISSWASDGLVMRYGYLMQHTVVTRTYTLLEERPLKGQTPKGSPSVSLVTETKLRRRANPFGFGVSWDGLTATQAAILAALGITRR